MRSRWGLRPNSPQQPAGMRIEPPPSEASAPPTRPAATAAAEPPLEPPGVRLRSHGLRVAPNVGVSVNGDDLELGHVGLADDHRAGGAQPADDLGVLARGLAVGVGAVRGDLAGDVGVVLDRDRDAEQRARVAAAAAAVGLVGLDQRALGEDDAEGVERGVEAGDALEVRLGQLARGELAGRRSARPGARGRRRRGRWPGGGHGGGGYRAWDDRPLHVTDVDAIAEGLARFEARGPCTDAERRARGWLHDELRDAGHEAWVETHWVRPQWALSMALHATIGVVASLVAITAPLPGLVAAAVAAVSMALEARRPAGAAAAGVPAAGDPERADGAGGGRRRAPHRARPTPRRAAGSGGGSSRAGRRGSRSRSRWWRCARACGSSTSTGCGSGCCSSCRRSRCCSRSRRRATRRSRRYVAGGEAPPAVAVALHDELRRNPPERLSPALLLHGALRAHLRREKPDRRAIVVLELGPERRARVRDLAPAAARGGRGGGRRPAGAAPGPAAAADAVDRRPRRRRARARFRARLRRRDRRRADLMQPGCISARSE